MSKMVKKLASLFLAVLMVLTVIVVPDGAIKASALTDDKTYYTERGTTARYTSATADDFAAKCDELTAAGYSLYSSNTIARNGRSLKVEADNLFKVYLNADKTELKHIAFYPTTKALHVTTQTLSANDALPLNNAPEYTAVCEPLFIQLMPEEAEISGGTSGMSYALRMRDGRFIMIDGALEGDNSTLQADTLFATLGKYNVLDKITVAAWIFTHAHSDHITTFTSLVNKYHASVNIEQLIYNYPSDADIVTETGMVDELKEGGIVYEQRKAIADYLANAKISTPYGGDVYKFPGVEIEFYLTPTDMFPVMCYAGDDFNTSSLIFKVKTEGQEILITGDSADYALMNVAIPRFGSSLGADMVQMVHHGITYGTGEFYELVGAEVAFWPILSSRVSNMMKQQQNLGLVNAPSTKEVILSSLGTRVITLPYTPTNKGGLFTTPEGYVVDDEIYKRAEVSKYGDIFNEDELPWSRSTNGYPLNNGGVYLTWGSVKLASSVTNGSDSAVYFNANSASIYAPVYGLEPNTTYSLSFDYMAASETVPSKGIFDKFGISGVNGESQNFSYNVYGGKSTTVNPNEVYGTANGWNHIEVTFTTDDTVYDEYYLSFFATVGAVGSSYKGYIDNISIARSKKTYYYYSEDYESLTNDAEWLSYGSNLTMSTTTDANEVIGGSTSLKFTSDYLDNIGTAVSNTVVPSSAKTRVSFNYNITEGTKGWGKVGYVGYNTTQKTYNWANISTGSYTEVAPEFASENASNTNKKFIGIVEKKNTTSGYMGFFWKNTVPTTIIVDNLIIAEIIGSVKALSSNENGGSATLKNKLDKSYTNFAINETAIFTATPNDGYYFDGWYDENGSFVSGNEVYEMTVTTDTELTARFKKGYKQDFENYTKTSSQYSGGFSLITNPEGGAVSGDKVMEFDAARATDTGTAKNRFVVNVESDSLALNDYAALGEKINISFKYKVGAGDKVRLYFYTGTTRSNASAHVKSYGRVDLSETSGWQEYTTSFTLDYTQAKSQITLTVFAGRTAENQTPATIMFDDVTISKEDYIDNFEYKGNAIRTSGNQALRYKYAINKSVLDTVTPSGYKVVEYGFIAANSEKTTSDPTLDTEGVIVSAAYISDFEGNLSKDIIFSETDDLKYVSAALYNIGVKNGTTDYNYYDKFYSIRLYVVFENESGDRKTIYSESYSSSVFLTVNAIFDAPATNEQVVKDKAEIGEFIKSNQALQNAYCTLYPDYSNNL